MFYFYPSDEYCGLQSPANTQPFLVNGFVHITKKQDGGHDATLLCRDASFMHIPVTLVSQYELQNGDWVELMASFKPSINRYLVDTVERVNGEIAGSKKERKRSYDSMDSTKPHIKGKINGTEILLGTRTIINLRANENKIDQIEKTQIEGPNIVKIALIIEESDYCLKLLEKAGFNEVFLIRPELSHKQQISMVLYALFIAKQEAINGKNAVLFIESLTKIVRLYDKICCGPNGLLDITKLFTGSLSDTKKLFMDAKQLGRAGSLTNIAFMHPPLTDRCHYIYSELLELSNQILEAPSEK